MSVPDACASDGGFLGHGLNQNGYGVLMIMIMMAMVMVMTIDDDAIIINDACPEGSAKRVLVRTNRCHTEDASTPAQQPEK